MTLNCAQHHTFPLCTVTWHNQQERLIRGLVGGHVLQYSLLPKDCNKGEHNNAILFIFPIKVACCEHNATKAVAYANVGSPRRY